MYPNEDLNSLQPRSTYGYDDSKVNFGSNPINLYHDREETNRPMTHKDNRLIQLEKDREFLILKNFELEKEINHLDQMFSQSFKIKQELSPDSKPKSPRSVQFNTNINQHQQQHHYHKQPESETVALKNKIKELEALCRDLQSKVDNTRTKSAIRIELTLWKNRTLELSQNYKTTLQQLNEELSQDKQAFKCAIKKIQTNFNNQVKQIESEYKPQMEKNEKKIAILQKESIELKKKEDKVKEIFLYNFK